MNLQELVTKVTEDKVENPYITLNDIQDIVSADKAKDDKLLQAEKERDDLKQALEKKNSDYEVLRNRIVDSVLSGKNIPNDENKKKENEKSLENITFKDLIK